MVPQNRKGIRPKTSMLEEDSQLQLIIKHSSWFFHSDMGIGCGGEVVHERTVYYTFNSPKSKTIPLMRVD